MIKFILNLPVLGRGLLIPIRTWGSFRYVYKQFSQYIVWLFKSKETTNFTYDLTDLNTMYLIDFVSTVTNKSRNEISGYVDEILNDQELFHHLNSAYKNSNQKYKTDPVPKFAKRIGWYAVIRAIKPKTVIETGIDKGLGSCVITSALLKNMKEGFNGFYYGTDINPKAGALFGQPYLTMGKILIGDSIDSLKKLSIEAIDVFINDSDHSADYEAMEYKIIENKLTDHSVILGDNSHANSKLREFAVATDRKFLFFQEMPKNHWYSGGGIGAAFK